MIVCVGGKNVTDVIIEIEVVVELKFQVFTWDKSKQYTRSAPCNNGCRIFLLHSIAHKAADPKSLDLSNI